MFFKKKQKKDKRWKCLKALDTMSDEDILNLEKKLYLKSGIMSVSGVILFILCVILIIVLAPYF